MALVSGGVVYGAVALAKVSEVLANDPVSQADG
jgi:hypothetical protein